MHNRMSGDKGASVGSAGDRKTPAESRKYSANGLGRLILPGLPAAAAVLFVALLFWPKWEETPDVIRVGVLPDQSPEALARRYDPLLAYLSAETDLPFELVVPEDYGAILDLFHTGAIDLAYFGGLTFLKARERDGAHAIAMRDVDARFRSYFLARPDSAGNSLADFRGATFAFGSGLSTSGHLMPRHFMARENVDPETWFAKVVYSGAHDRTAYMVRDGEADLGVANAEIVDAMFRDGRLRRSEVRVAWQTSPYVDYVWALRAGIDGDLEHKLTMAFLRLSPYDADDADILQGQGAGSFLPMPAGDLEALREIAASLDLLG